MPALSTSSLFFGVNFPSVRKQEQSNIRHWSCTAALGYFVSGRVATANFLEATGANQSNPGARLRLIVPTTAQNSLFFAFCTPTIWAIIEIAVYKSIRVGRAGDIKSEASALFGMPANERGTICSMFSTMHVPIRR
jgi:hypothetical protein